MISQVALVLFSLLLFPHFAISRYRIEEEEDLLLQRTPSPAPTTPKLFPGLDRQTVRAMHVHRIREMAGVLGIDSKATAHV